MRGGGETYSSLAFDVISGHNINQEIKDICLGDGHCNVIALQDVNIHHNQLVN